ncbi:hypothetical protein ACIBH1_01805 [Nonomuraea sp. NPDC050663]|uniref:hypothetical protein n=1 Tax=Nonomuraea sp. NPDC050663 TaxID=3364370 RepID=UPI0017D9DAF3|nr:hypothetical protein [Thermoactinospora sp.]
MQRKGNLHRTDWMALLSGLLFLVVGILLLTGALTDWVLLASLTVGGLAIAGVISVITRLIRGGR